MRGPRREIGLVHGVVESGHGDGNGYVSNKAGLTGQTVPGRRIPGHWPYLGPDELAETEPIFARGLETCAFFF